MSTTSSITVCFELTEVTARRSVARAGGDPSQLDAVEAVVEASKSAHKVRLNNVENFIATMWREGYRVYAVRY